MEELKKVLVAVKDAALFFELDVQHQQRLDDNVLVLIVHLYQVESALCEKCRGDVPEVCEEKAFDDHYFL